MTSEQSNDGEQYLPATFAILPEKLEGQGRSFGLLLLHRRCAACWGALIQEPAGGLELPWQDHLVKIAEHCSANQDFVSPGLPIMEAVFRVLLSNGNQPTTLEEVLAVLQKQWSDSASHWVPPPAKLHRMLTRDVFYGIGSVPPPT
ncbi:MAG: hypothetical protein HY533_06500 [Chloroflexi bacterium]|nr:hypothetical protein [Chloroflexota bacterium]